MDTKWELKCSYELYRHKTTYKTSGKTTHTQTHQMKNSTLTIQNKKQQFIRNKISAITGKVLSLSHMKDYMLKEVMSCPWGSGNLF